MLKLGRQMCASMYMYMYIVTDGCCYINIIALEVSEEKRKTKSSSPRAQTRSNIQNYDHRTDSDYM